MKKLKSIGSLLSKSEMKRITGGDLYECGNEYTFWFECVLDWADENMENTIEYTCAENTGQAEYNIVDFHHGDGLLNVTCHFY